ncbi:MAG: hypothetical protein AABZ53_11005 [Planctomycetota bacterium]
MLPPADIIRLAPSQEHRRAEWPQALAHFDPGTAISLKKDGLDGVWRTTIYGRDLALKCLTHSSPLACIKSFFHLSRSFRQWRGAELLLKARIDTAEPIVLATRCTRQKGLTAIDTHEWIATAFVEGPTLLKLFAQGRFTTPLATAVGRHLAGMARGASLFNRDHKPSNLIVNLADDPEHCRITILDTVGIRTISPASHLRFTARMLASLIIEPTGCGHPPPEAFIRAIAQNAVPAGPIDADRLFSAALAIRKEHGDPTPRVNPLA